MLGLLKRSHALKSVASKSARNFSGPLSVHATLQNRAAQRKESSHKTVKSKDLGIGARIRAEEEERFGIAPRTQVDTPSGMNKVFSLRS